MPVGDVTRHTARIVLMNEDEQIFLLYVDDPSVVEAGKGRKKPFWVTPGGKIEENETEKEAVKRELFEETGISEDSAEFGPCVWFGECDLLWKGVHTHMIEKFFLVKITKAAISEAYREEAEAKVIKKHSWFSVSDLKDSTEIFIPKDLPILFSRVVDKIRGCSVTSIEYEPKKIDLSAPENLYEKV